MTVATAQPAPDALTAALVGHPKVAALVQSEPAIAEFARANPDVVALALKDPEAVKSNPKAVGWAFKHPFLAAQLQEAANQDAETKPAPRVEPNPAPAPPPAPKPMAESVADYKRQDSPEEIRRKAIAKAQAVQHGLGTHEGYKAPSLADKAIAASPLGPNDKSLAAYRDIKARWGLLFAWAGGDQAHLRDRVHEIHPSLDHWLAFSRKWEQGTQDAKELQAIALDLEGAERFSAEHGYGAPSAPIDAPPPDESSTVLAAAGAVGGALEVCKVTDLSKMTMQERAARLALCPNVPLFTEREKIAIGVGVAGVVALVLFSLTRNGR